MEKLNGQKIIMTSSRELTFINSMNSPFVNPLTFAV